MKKTLFFDATSCHWTGASVYLLAYIKLSASLAKFNSSIDKIDNIFFLVLLEQVQLLKSIGLSPNQMIILDSGAFPAWLPTLIVKSIGLKKILQRVPPTSLFLVNSQFIFLCKHSGVFKVWHASLHLCPKLFLKYLLVKPLRFCRLLVELSLDCVNSKFFAGYIYPSAWCRNLVINRIPLAKKLKGAVIQHDLQYLHAYRNSIHSYDPSLPQSEKPEPTLRLIYVASLDIYKNHDLLLSWLDKCTAIPFELVLVGPLVVSSVLDNIKLSIAWKAGKVSYLGRLSNEEVVTLYKSSHVALAFSSAETFGYPVAEAMYFRVPLVYYDNICNSELGSFFGHPVSSASQFQDLIHKIYFNYSFYFKSLNTETPFSDLIASDQLSKTINFISRS